MKYSFISEELKLNPNTKSVYKSDLDYFDKWVNTYKSNDDASTHELIHDFTLYQQKLNVGIGTIKRRLAVVKKYHPLLNNKASGSQVSTKLPTRFFEDLKDFLLSSTLERSSAMKYLRNIKNAKYFQNNNPPFGFTVTLPSDIWLNKFLNAPNGQIYQHLFQITPNEHFELASPSTVEPSSNKTHNLLSMFGELTRSFFRITLVFSLVILVFGISSSLLLPNNLLAVIPNSLIKKNNFGISLSLKTNNLNVSVPNYLDIKVQDEASKREEKCTLSLNNENLSPELIFYFNSKYCSNSFQKIFLPNNFLSFRVNNEFWTYPPQKIADLQNPSYFAYNKEQFFDPDLDLILPSSALIDQKTASTASLLKISPLPTPTATTSAIIIIPSPTSTQAPTPTL